MLALGEGGCVDKGCIPAVGTAFGGGIGGRGALCGIVGGGVIAIGLFCDRRDAEDRESKDRAYALARRYYRSFEEVEGSTLCRELTGLDFLVQADCARYYEVEHKRCTERVRQATHWLAEAMAELVIVEG